MLEKNISIGTAACKTQLEINDARREYDMKIQEYREGLAMRLQDCLMKQADVAFLEQAGDNTRDMERLCLELTQELKKLRDGAREYARKVQMAEDDLRIKIRREKEALTQRLEQAQVNADRPAQLAHTPGKEKTDADKKEI